MWRLMLQAVAAAAELGSGRFSAKIALERAMVTADLPAEAVRLLRRMLDRGDSLGDVLCRLVEVTQAREARRWRAVMEASADAAAR